MSTYRDELSADYPELKDAPIFTIGCPHSWGYCDKADTPCGKIGRANVKRHHCDECWAQKMDRPKPYRIEYRDENGGKVTNCVMKWFVHTYTRIPMCIVRVEREDGSVGFDTITKDEFYRRWGPERGGCGMTYREKYRLDHPDRPLDIEEMCPTHFGYELLFCANPADKDEVRATCEACWDREMPPRDRMTPRILDSGARRQFETGAVRDIQEGKGRPGLMPLRVLAYIWRTIDPDYADKGVDKARVFEWIADFMDTGDTKNLIFAINSFTGYLDWPTALLEVAKHFEEGAKKYGENNWQKGLPVNCYIDSAVRHYLKWLRGDTDEPHDRAFVWNLLCCIWEVDFSPRAKGETAVADTVTLYADNTPIKHIPSDMVRYCYCPAGLFETDEGVYVKTEIADADKYGAYIAIHVNTGRTRLFDNDILVRPIDSPFTDERCGDE